MVITNNCPVLFYPVRNLARVIEFLQQYSCLYFSVHTVGWVQTGANKSSKTEMNAMYSSHSFITLDHIC